MSGARIRRFGAISAAALAVAAAGLVLGFPPAETYAHRFADGRLWRVSQAGVEASYVFGTIHIPDPRVSSIPPLAGEALARSRLLAMELAPVAVDDAGMLEIETLADGRSLESLIGPEAFSRLRSELAARGVPDAAIAGLKPWAALLKLSPLAPSAEAMSLDERLHRAARARRLPVVSLESIDDQVAAFDAIPQESQVALLTHALAHRDALEATVEPTIAAWLRGDLAGLARIAGDVAKRFPAMEVHYARLSRHIIRDRTALLHHRLFLPLRQGRAFVALGALHLYGREGLLALLERDGYRVERIW